MDLIDKIFKGDKGIWIAFGFLCIISILEFFSSSSSLSYKTADHWSPLTKHIMTLFIGFIAMVVTSCFNYTKVRIFLLYGLGFIACSTLLYASVKGFMGHGLLNGTSRWLYVPFTGITYQPSELVKLWLIIVTAHFLSLNQASKEKDNKRTLINIIGISALPVILITLENFSTAALISLVILIMLWIGQINWRFFALLIGVVVSITFISYSAYKIFPNANIFRRVPTWEARFVKFLAAENVPPEQYDLDANRQRGNANIAISKSNLLGSGFGNSTQRDLVSHAYSDLIFAIIIEETGLIGGAFVIFLYLMILLRVGNISNKLKDPYAILFIQGVALMIALQALIHIFVSVNIMPITGQPLPIISKGGTSIVINCFELGLILSISRSIRQEKEDTIDSDNNEELIEN